MRARTRVFPWAAAILALASARAGDAPPEPKEPSPPGEKAPEKRAPAEPSSEAKRHPAELDPASAQAETHPDVQAWIDAAEREMAPFLRDPANVARVNWDRAFAFFQAAIDQDRYPVAKAKEDDAGILYLSVRDHCQRRIARLPANATWGYGRTWGRAWLQAGRLFLDAKKPGGEWFAWEILRRYAATTYGERAALLLADRALDRGDLREARYALERVRELSMWEDPDEEVVTVRQAVRSRAEKLLAEASKPDPSELDSWPMAGGAPTGARAMPEGKGVLGEKVLGVKGTEAPFRIPVRGSADVGDGVRYGLLGLPRRDLADLARAARRAALMEAGFAEIPQLAAPALTAELDVKLVHGWEAQAKREVVKDRFLVLAWPDQKVRAYRLSNGKEYWVGPGSGDPNGEPPAVVLPRFGPIGGEPGQGKGAPVLGPRVALSRDYAYGIYSLPSALDAAADPRERVNGLYALEVATGKVAWVRGRISGNEPRPETADAFLDHSYFLCAPVPAGGRIYALAWNDGGFYVLAIAEGRPPEGGRLLWKTRIASGPLSAPPAPGAPAPPVIVPPDAALAADDGIIVAATGRGIIAAVEPAFGEVKWVRKYETIHSPRVTETPRGPLRRLPPPPARGWDGSSVVLLPDRAIVVPADADAAYAFGRSDGELRWMVAPDDRWNPKFWGTVRYVAGVTRGFLVFGGRQTLVVHAATGRLVYAWPKGSRDGSLPDGAAPRGRPAVGEKHIYVPTAGGIRVLDVDGIAKIAELLGTRGRGEASEDEKRRAEEAAGKLLAEEPPVVKPEGWDDGRLWSLSIFQDYLFLFGEEEAYAFKLLEPKPAPPPASPGPDPAR